MAGVIRSQGRYTGGRHRIARKIRFPTRRHGMPLNLEKRTQKALSDPEEETRTSLDPEQAARELPSDHKEKTREAPSHSEEETLEATSDHDEETHETPLDPKRHRRRRQNPEGKTRKATSDPGVETKD